MSQALANQEAPFEEMGVHETALPDFSQASLQYPNYEDAELVFSTKQPFEHAPLLVTTVDTAELPEFQVQGRDFYYVGFVALATEGKLILPAPAAALGQIIGWGIQTLQVENQPETQCLVTWVREPISALAEFSGGGWHFDGNTVVAALGGAGTEYILHDFPRDDIAGATTVQEDEVDMTKFWRAPNGSVVKKHDGTIHRRPQLTEEEVAALTEAGIEERVVITMNGRKNGELIEPTEEAVAKSVLIEDVLPNVRTYAVRGILANKQHQAELQKVQIEIEIAKRR